MQSLFRVLMLALCLFALTQSARSDVACGATAASGTMSGMPANHQMDGHSSPSRVPHHHPCGPMSGALCQGMTGCMDIGTPVIAFEASLSVARSATPETVIARAVPLNDLAPPLTPPRA